MPDVVHDFPIVAPAARVFEALSTPAGLDVWWTKSSTGEPVQGATYELHFGKGYDWRAVLRVYVPMKRIEYEFIEASILPTKPATIACDGRAGPRRKGQERERGEHGTP